MIETVIDGSNFQDTSIIEDMYMPESREEVNMILRLFFNLQWS